MEDIRRIVNPLGARIRRAVLTDTGLLADQADHPSLPEIDMLSEICGRLFPGTEPRHSPILLQRAFKFNVITAWAAIYDDLKCDVKFDVSSYTDDFASEMLRATNWKHLYVVAKFASSTAGWTLDDPESIQSLIRQFVIMVKECDQDLASNMMEVLQDVVSQINPSVDTVYKTVMEMPSSAGLFIKHQELSHLAMKVGIGHCVCEYTATQRAEDRYYTLAFVAKLIQLGHRVTHPVGLDTLTSLSSKRFDIHIAAAAAVIAREDDDPTVRHLTRLIETLAATIHSYLV